MPSSGSRVAGEMPSASLAVLVLTELRNPKPAYRIACFAAHRVHSLCAQVFVLFGTFLFLALLFFLMCPQSVLTVEMVKQVLAPLHACRRVRASSSPCSGQWSAARQLPPGTPCASN